MKPVALLTGASRGIGRATARLLSARGWDLALFYGQNREKAEASLLDALTAGADAALFQAELCDPAATEAAIRDAAARFGHLDALVTCAGLADQRLLQDVDDGTYARLMGVNLDAPFRLCRAVLPDMIRRQRGAIVLVSSMWGQTGGSCEAVYSAAKAGVIGLTRALAKEVGPSGIRVNCVAPGVILTDMTQPLGEETLRALAADTPLGRNGTPEDVARAIAFLLSEDASFITGQVLGVNGGLVT